MSGWKPLRVDQSSLGDLADVDMAATAPAKGSVAVFDGTDWVALPVGSNDQVLTANSAEAKGVKWAAGGGGGNAAYAETIGDNSNTSYQVTHDLGTQDIIVQLWDLTGSDPVEATADADSITIDDTNNITVAFSAAPAVDSYRVVVVSDGGSSGGSVIESDSEIVDTSQTTSSASFTDLATVGPAATVDVPASGVVIVHIRCTQQHSSSSGVTQAGFALSGANTVVAAAAIATRHVGSNPVTMQVTTRVTGLTPGSTTFTMKYLASAATGTFQRREIVVETRP